MKLNVDNLMTDLRYQNRHLKMKSICSVLISVLLMLFVIIPFRNNKILTTIVILFICGISTYYCSNYFLYYKKILNQLKNHEFYILRSKVEEINFNKKQTHKYVKVKDLEDSIRIKIFQPILKDSTYYFIFMKNDKLLNYYNINLTTLSFKSKKWRNNILDGKYLK